MGNKGDLEKTKRKTKLLLFLIVGVVILLAAAGGWLLVSQEVPAFSDSIDNIISLDSGFYKEDQTISVSVPKGACVYYTSNCTVPDQENGIAYTEPITMVAPEEEMVYVYRFKIYYEDGTESEVLNRTYFMGTNIDTRYTTNVLHITGDPEELFGYENGIFARGRLFDEWVAEHPEDGYGGGVNANFMLSGEEYERPVYIDYFSESGEQLLSQNGGVRVYGGMTRMKNQKSFKLYARKEYDEQNEFDYPAIGGLVSTVDGTVAQEHKRLVVRNSGNDNGFAFIRNELTSRLAGEAGFPDVMQADPVCVYINGEYYGIYWLENAFDAQYFENRYGQYDGEFVVLEGADYQKKDSDDATEQIYVEEYNALYDKFSAMDLTIDENFAELEKVLDVENYLQYFAIENYVGNHDWPDNNLKAYRYVSPDGNYEENSVFDGRYRHLLYDVDYSFGLLVYDHLYGTYPGKKTLERILNEEYPLFCALMERQDCREFFVSYTCDLMNGVMSREHVEETLSEMHASRYEELYHMLQETDVQQDSLWNWESLYSIYYDSVETSYRMILEYASYHPATVLEDMAESFGYDMDEIYALNVVKSGLSNVQVNTVVVEADAFTGSYFGSIPVYITPSLVRNEVFDYWLVNGEVRSDEELVLSSADVQNQQITVEMVVHTVEEPVLQLNAVKAKGGSDFIEIINLSDQTVSTKNYFLSDEDDRYKYALPVMTILPGEVKRFYGKDCMDAEALGALGLNFNLKQGETIRLTYGTETLETLFIPDLSKEGVYQRDEKTGKFIEVLQRESE